MKHKLVRLLCILLLVAGLWVATVPFTSAIGNDLDTVRHAPARRSLLSAPSKHETALLAGLDGTVHFVDHRSSKVLWSFKSGPSIYSSYQASVDDDNNDKENTSQLGSFFIDCGDDWALYMHYALRKEKLQENFEDFISKSPVIVEDGGTLLGSKKSTVFLVDAKTGRLIYTYGLSDSPSASQSNDEESVLDGTSLGELRRSSSSNLKPDDQRLYITRTDYLLEAFAPNNKVLWNLTVADIGAAFLYPEIEKRGALSDPRYVPSKAVVYRVRNPSTLGPYKPNMLPEVHDQDMFLAQSNSNYMLLWQTEADKLSELHHKDEILSLPDPNPFLSSESNIKEIPKSHQKGEIDQVQDVKMHLYDGLHIYVTLPFLSFVFILVGFVAYYCLLAARKDVNSNKQPTDLNTRTMPSKRKKIRKSGKSNGLNEESDEKASSGEGHVDRPWLKLNQPMDDSKNGRTIGKLYVSNSEIAKGSNGTIVLEGIYEGRPVAVKRLVKAHHDVAYKEIQNLIASDRHPNIVRWYGVESDQDFVYLALERCACSFSDLIQMNLDISEKLTFTVEQSIEVMTEDKVRMDVKGILQDVRLWKENGYPSPVLLKLMRDVVSGLMHLHELGIIHRDLKPQNVLIIKERSLCAKLSDMGISKRLVEDRSSLGHYATGYGSSGWQAPEQLLHGRQTRAVDMFSLGCVLFYCITGGKHPFGEPLERDINIVKNKIDLFLVDYIPEAVDLFSRILDPDADLRPTASEVFHHPLFWNSEDRLSFLRDTSDRVELENRETKSDLLSALENIAPVALGTKWDEKMEPAFLNNIGRYRRYKFDSVRDLLRVMRNKLNHYRELPVEIQEILGSVPEGFDGYFASRFPKLLIEVYKVMHKYCKEEEFFSKYFKGNII